MSRISETSFKLELGLHVAQLDAAVEFYAKLFGVAPVRRLPEFARFEIDEPPVVLSLRAGPDAVNGALNHVGFRVADVDQLLAVQQRLEVAGIVTQREEGVECCYSRQTKFWVSDVDANQWEIYSLEDDTDHDEHTATESAVLTEDAVTVWGHRAPEPFTLPLPLDDASVDEVHLDGTLDNQRDRSERLKVLRDVCRVLRPGGAVAIRAERMDESANDSRLFDELAEAGLVAGQLEQLPTHNATHLGTARFSAVKPFVTDDSAHYEVLYRGPLQSVTDEHGRMFARGRRVSVDAAMWQLFQQPPFASSFTCFPEAQG